MKKKTTTLLLLTMAITTCMACGATPVSDTQTGTELVNSEGTKPDTTDTQFDTEEYALPEDLDTTDVNYPIPYGKYIPSQEGPYRTPNNFWLYVWAADSNIHVEEEEWQTATLNLSSASISVDMALPSAEKKSFENITYKKTRTLNEEELEFFSYYGFNMRLDDYYADNSPCTMYDVCTEDGKVPYKLIVFRDKVWLMVSRSDDLGFSDMEDLLWYGDDLHFIIEFVPK